MKALEQGVGQAQEQGDSQGGGAEENSEEPQGTASLAVAQRVREMLRGTGSPRTDQDPSSDPHDSQESGALLTPREVSVLEELQRNPGASSTKIAAQLGIGSSSVRRYLGDIRRKFEAGPEEDLVALARERSLIGRTEEDHDRGDIGDIEGVA